MKTCTVCGVRKAESHFDSEYSKACKRCADGAPPAKPEPLPAYEVEILAIREMCAAMERLPAEGQTRAIEFVSRRYVGATGAA